MDRTYGFSDDDEPHPMLVVMRNYEMEKKKNRKHTPNLIRTRIIIFRRRCIYTIIVIIMCMCKYKQCCAVISAVFKQISDYCTRALSLGVERRRILLVDFRALDHAPIYTILLERRHTHTNIILQYLVIIIIFVGFFFIEDRFFAFFSPKLYFEKNTLFIYLFFFFQFSARKTAQESIVRGPVSGRVRLALEPSAEETPSRKRWLRRRSLRERTYAR